MLANLPGCARVLSFAGGEPTKCFTFDELAKVPTTGALSRGAWGALDVLEMLCAILLVVPSIANWMPVLTPLAGAALALVKVRLQLGGLALPLPWTDARVAFRRDVRDEAGFAAERFGREFNFGTQIDSSQPLKDFCRASLGDSGPAVDDQILLETHGVLPPAQQRERDARVVAQILDLLPLTHVRRDELVAVDGNPYH